MKWSWKFMRIAGIDVYMHATFLILLGWVGVSHYIQRFSIADAWSGIIFIVALFGIVILHELGHALMARRFGIRTRDITLLPIGGIARLERMPEDPKQELLVALAGPAVNVVLAAVFFVFVPATTLMTLMNVRPVGGRFLSNMLWVNLTLAVFNLIPAFPMDGGRVLRSLLAMRMDYLRATQIAAATGQGLALMFGFVGLFTNPFLVFIALFVWMGAAGEASMVQIKSALGGIPIRHVMITNFRTLAPQDPLANAVEHVLAGFQEDFPVVEDGHLVGILMRTDLMKALAQRGQDTPIAEVMQRQFQIADPAEMAETVFARLQACNCHSLPVTQGGQLVGIVTAGNVGEFLMIQTALRERGGPSTATALSHA
jgi:Zn-dependent protease